ncbi:unknown [Firmicutes bacterium CAG:534]|nr:unknown [Firmicutes bacterium CAG:534]
MGCHHMVACGILLWQSECDQRRLPSFDIIGPSLFKLPGSFFRNFLKSCFVQFFCCRLYCLVAAYTLINISKAFLCNVLFHFILHFCARSLCISSLCQVRADTNLTCEKFCFSHYSSKFFSEILKGCIPFHGMQPYDPQAYFF